ncbi:MAG TPA: OmpA family protein, partial [Edaphobacter sp.]|nr:OmpA family protein [Edaphobacter sp.]
GYGMAKPVADNSTAKGRALNRRVQLVVSGDAIGVEQKGPDADASPMPGPTAEPAPQQQQPAAGYRGTANPPQ